MSLFGKWRRKKSETAGPTPAAEKKSLAEAKENAVIKPKAQEPGPRESLAHRVLLYPVVSEKAARVAEFRHYVFAVTPNSNKHQIKRAIQEVYGVKPKAVKIITTAGKAVRVRGRLRGATRAEKKAVITLAKGQEIKVYEGV